MKLEDLRLGNWVKIDVGIGQVCCLMTVEFEDYSLGEGMPICVDVEEYACPRSCTIEEVEGIELTEDILLGCGFKEIPSALKAYKQYSFDSKLTKRQCALILYSLDGRNFVTTSGHDDIKYVHEIQNVFYAMNKEDLEVKL